MFKEEELATLISAKSETPYIVGKAAHLEIIMILYGLSYELSFKLLDYARLLKAYQGGGRDTVQRGNPLSLVINTHTHTEREREREEPE